MAHVSWRQGGLGRLLSSISLHGPGIVVESLIVWVTLEMFQFLGYGGQPGGPQGPAFYLPMTMVLAGAAMGAGEARFKLYRRVWSVAGLNDAVAIGAAVIEAALLITIANALMPDGERAYRLLVPVLATPAMVIGVGLFRLAPRMLSRVPASSNAREISTLP